MKEIAIIGFAQSLFFMIILLLKNHKRLKDYLLALFFLFLSFELLYRYLQATDFVKQSDWFILLDILYWAMFGPLLILYINSLIIKDYTLQLRHLLHITVLLISLYGVSGYMLDRSSYSSFFGDYYERVGGLHKIVLWVWEFASAIYLLWGIFRILKHKRISEEFYSNLKNKDLKWLLILITGFAVYIYGSYVSWILRDVFNLVLSFRFIDILAAILTIYVFVLGIFGYKQDGVFFDKSILKYDHLLKTKNRMEPQVKYLKTGVGIDELENINHNLKVFMEAEKPYLDCELNLGDLAEKLNTTLHKLSQTINLLHNKNFFEYINSYRIDEFKRLIKESESENLKIESLAYDCGFNSKSAFYAIFKRHTNMTPTQYKHQILNKN